MVRIEMSDTDWSTRIPKGWIVFDCGQEPVFHLWHCVLIENPVKDGQTRRHVRVDEQDTMQEALRKAVEMAEAEGPREGIA